MAHYSDFVEQFAKNADCTKSDAKFIIQAFVRTTRDFLDEYGRLNLYGLGRFDLTTKKAQARYDINTGEVKLNEARETVKFTPSPDYLKEINERRK